MMDELSPIFANVFVLAQLLLPFVAAVAPISFPPSQNWDGDDGQWSSFSLRLGDPEQVVRVLPSTSGYNVIVPAPEACNSTSDYTSCATARAGIFDRTKSITWQNEGFFGVGMQANLGYGAIEGAFGFDEVGLGIAVNPNLTFPNQVIGGIVAEEFYIGMFGLGTQPTNFTTTSNPHTSFFTALKDANEIPSYTWAYTAGAKYQHTGVLGSLTFGGYDGSRFMPNNVSIPMSPDVSRDLVVGLQSISTNYTTGSNQLLPSGGIFAFVDSTLPFIWLPLDACQAFERVFGLTWNDTAEMYLLDDALHVALSKSNPTFTFTVGMDKAGGATVDLILPYASFDLVATPPQVDNTTRYFPLKRAANETQYTLGRAFLQETYLIADYERGNFSLSQCIFNPTATPNIIPIKSIADTNRTALQELPHDHPSVSKGALAGIIIAALLLVIFLGLGIWLRVRPKITTSGTTTEDEATEELQDKSPNDVVDKGVPEAMSSQVFEAQDEPVAATFAGGGGRHEMPAGEATANELCASDARIYEMFDGSVYRELASSNGK